MKYNCVNGSPKMCKALCLLIMKHWYVIGSLYWLILQVSVSASLGLILL